jgi:hypothetical protein
MRFPQALLSAVLLALTASCSSTPEKVDTYDEDLDNPATARTSLNKFTVISDSFDNSEYVPEISEFDKLDEPYPKMRCLSVKASKPEVMDEMVIRRMEVTFAGNPSYGPLFPGTPDRTETVLAIGKNNGWLTARNLPNEKRQVFELHPNGDSIVIRIVENSYGIYQDLGNPAEVWIRKHKAGNIFFKVFRVDASQNRQEAFVGYCFTKSL